MSATGRKHAWDGPMSGKRTPMCVECGCYLGSFASERDCPGTLVLNRPVPSPRPDITAGPTTPSDLKWTGSVVTGHEVSTPERDLASAAATIIGTLDPDPRRGGVAETPQRVAKYWREMTAGYAVDIASLFKTFDEDASDMVVMKEIDFVSTCEHHLALFHGQAAIAYIPDAGRVIGLSKMARLVDAFARRFQVQERITQQIADALVTHLKPKGVVVVLYDCVHTCMMARGVRSRALTVTSAVRGVFERDSDARSEALRLMGR